MDSRSFAEHVGRCLAILNGSAEPPHVALMADWWARLQHHERLGLLYLSGLTHWNKHTGRDWHKLPERVRAAVLLTVRDFAPKLTAIRGTIDAFQAAALRTLKGEAATVHALPAPAVAAASERAA